MSVRVLIVEDESMIAMLTEDLLADMGYDVVPPVATVPAALDVLAAEQIGMALLDVNLGGTMSFPVADALQRSGIPFLFVTGYGRAGVPEQYHAVPVLKKPFRRRDLQAALSGLQAGSGAA